MLPKKRNYWSQPTDFSLSQPVRKSLYLFSLAFFALNPTYFFVQLSKQLDQQCSNSNFLFQLCNFPTKRIYKRQYILIQYLCKSHKKAKKRYMCLLRSQDILTPEGECGRWQDTDASPARKNVLLLYWQQKKHIWAILQQPILYSPKASVFWRLHYFGWLAHRTVMWEPSSKSTKPVD